MEVNRVLATLAESLFPSRCCLCLWPCDGALPLCAACRADMPVNRLCCQRCALPLNNASAAVCGNCLHHPPAFDKVIAPWLYGEYLAYIVHRWKFQGERRLTRLLAHLWFQQVGSPGHIDALAPVPLHWTRQWRRGFNQSHLLALALQAESPQLQVNAGLLQRRKRTAAQSGMNARQRAHNLRQAFTASKACDNLAIAVVDDVLTTGATANEIAKVLKKAGARHVEIWCIARTPAPGD